MIRGCAAIVRAVLFVVAASDGRLALKTIPGGHDDGGMIFTNRTWNFTGVTMTLIGITSQGITV